MKVNATIPPQHDFVEYIPPQKNEIIIDNYIAVNKDNTNMYIKNNENEEDSSSTSYLTTSDDEDVN